MSDKRLEHLDPRTILLPMSPTGEPTPATLEHLALFGDRIEAGRQVLDVLVAGVRNGLGVFELGSAVDRLSPGAARFALYAAACVLAGVPVDSVPPGPVVWLKTDEAET